MPLGYVIAPARLVKGENSFPEVRNILPSLEQAAIRRAGEIWKGFSFGGILPGANQFGMNTFRPRDIHGGGTATWVKTYGSPGSWANIWSYVVPEDEIHAFAGVGIPDPSIIFAQLRLEVEDRRFPIIDIEEARLYEGGYQMIFKQDAGKELIVPEEQRVLLRGFQERNTDGMTQRIIPLGFQLYRNKDLHLTEREVNN